MQTNLNRFIYVGVMLVIFLALASFLLAEEPELKMNYKVENGNVLITFTNLPTDFDDSKLEFKVDETPIKKEKIDGVYKLEFPFELKNQTVNLRVFYNNNCIGSFSFSVPVAKEDIKITDVKIKKEDVELTLSGAIYDDANIEFCVEKIYIEKIEEQKLPDGPGNRHNYKYTLIFPYELKTKEVELIILNDKKPIGSVLLDFPEQKEDITVGEVKQEKDAVRITINGTIANDANLEFKVDETILRKQRVINNAGYERVYELKLPYELKNERINLKVFYKKNCIASVPILISDDRTHLTITYDCSDLKNPLRDCKDEKYVVHYRNHVTFRVINANPLRYRVTLTGQNKNYFTETSKVYQDAAKEAMTMKLSEQVQAPPESLTNVAKKFASDAKRVQEINLKNITDKKISFEKADQEYNTAKEKSDKILKDFNDALDALNKAKEELKITNGDITEEDLDKKVDSKIQNAYKTAERAYKDPNYNKLLDETTKKEKILIQTKAAYETIQNEVNEKVEKLEAVYIFLMAYDKLSKLEDFYNHLVTLSLSNDSVDTIQENIEPILDKVLTETSKTEGKDKNFEFEIDRIVPMLKQWLNEAQDAYPKIDFDWFKKAENLYNDKFSPGDIKIVELCKERMDKIVEMDIIGKIQTLISVIKKPENFVQSITIPTVDSDEVHFTARIEAIPNAVSTTDSVSKLIGPVVVKVTHGWAINFSTGVVFHLNAHDRSYRLERATNQGNDLDFTTYTIKENENKNSITPSVTGLMHIYHRTASNVKMGILFGIGTKDIEKFHYYIGTSLMIGNLRRFVVNAGVVITKIDFLKPEYKKGDSIVLANAIDSKSQLLVEKQFKARLFFGFTYNLTSE